MGRKQGKRRNQPSAAEKPTVVKETPGNPVKLSPELGRLQTNPNLFEIGKTTMMASALPIIEASSILTQRHHLPWEKDANGKLCYAKSIGSGAVHFWVTEDLEAKYPATLAGAAALASIERFDIRATCMHLIYAAHATQLKRSWEEDLVIDDRQIESYLGLHRRTDLNREQKLALIKELVEQPCKITTFITWPKQGNRKGFTVEEGRLWHLMGTRYHYQTDLFGNKTVVGMSFIVRAGLWAKYFLNEEGNRSRTAYYQRGMLPKLLLESVMSLWQHREGAARLMVWLLFKTQTRQEAFPVKTLLEVAYGTTAVEQARSDRLKRKKIVNDWDEVLLSLHERGWRLTFDETYPVEIQPLGFGRTTEKRPRGFFDLLLVAYLWIEPEESVANEALLLQEGTTPVFDSQPAPAPDELTPEWIKELRQRKGWSQRDLAKAAKVSQTLVCQLEKGTRSITEESRSQLSVAFGIGC